MNKGLEVIEAHELFGIPYDRIEVVVHPQSVVHSMVELVDGATIAQLSLPDMRLPIGYAMGWPGAHRHALRRARLVRPLALDLRAAGPSRLRLPRPRLPGRPARAAPPRLGSTRPTRWRWPLSSTGDLAGWGSPRWWRTRWTRCTDGPMDSVEARAGGRPPGPARTSRRSTARRPTTRQGTAAPPRDDSADRGAWTGSAHRSSGPRAPGGGRRTSSPCSSCWGWAPC